MKFLLVLMCGTLLSTTAYMISDSIWIGVVTAFISTVIVSFLYDVIEGRYSPKRKHLINIMKSKKLFADREGTPRNPFLYTAYSASENTSSDEYVDLIMFSMEYPRSISSYRTLEGKRIMIEIYGVYIEIHLDGHYNALSLANIMESLEKYKRGELPIVAPILIAEMSVLNARGHTITCGSEIYRRYGALYKRIFESAT